MSKDDTYYSDIRARNLFGYRVEDDSTAPVFRIGDIAVVNPNLPAGPGDYVVIKTAEKISLVRISEASRMFGKTGVPSGQTAADTQDILGRVVERKRIYR